MINTDKKAIVFDLIIVYSSLNYNKATSPEDLGKFPFSSQGDSDIYNESYQYFLLQCEAAGIKAAFTTSKDIIGPGLFQKFWTYDTQWTRNHEKAYAQVIFDKFTPKNDAQEERLELLTSSPSIFMFNNEEITALFQNKLDTFNYFKEFAIPTVEITDPSQEGIILAKASVDKLLENHRYEDDFNDGYIIKDATGAGGFNIHKVEFNSSGIKEILKNYTIAQKKKKRLTYILQPFINCVTGFVFKDYGGPTDIRIIMMGTKIIQTYIRVAQEGKFECNIHQGGSLFYISQDSIPAEVLEMNSKIVDILDKTIDLNHTLYALDFMQSNKGNVYFIEGNSTPGIIWEQDNKIDETKSKELIDIIISELQSIIIKKKQEQK